MKRFSHALLPFALAAVAIFAPGCFPGYLKIKVTSASTTNDSLPFFMLIRAVDPKTYAAESYADVAPKVMNPDASVLKAVQIYPGTPATIWVKVPPKGTVAAYFLLTNPADPWRTQFDAPTPYTAEIELLGNRIRPDVRTLGQPQAPESGAPGMPAMPQVAAPKKE